MLQAVLGVNRAYLLTHPERVLTDYEWDAYAALFNRRLIGEPIAYLLGVREFHGLNFHVTTATLIPRSDTELLVELALQRMTLHTVAAGGGRTLGCRVLDMGTGSGAIALSIAHERPDAAVIAVDASCAALEVARFNAINLGVDNVRLLSSDWYSALSGERFDLIVSNPPYIEAGDSHLVQGDLRFEPLSALASGVDGLDDIRHIVGNARDYLFPGGWLMVEHGYNQALGVRQLMQQNGLAEIASYCDLSGIERVTTGRA